MSSSRLMDGETPFVPLKTVLAWEPLAAELGVSQVARSARGFLAAYRRAGGDPRKLSESWRRKRIGFVKRMRSQARINRESLLKAGRPSRRLLALVMWADSPVRLPNP